MRPVPAPGDPVVNAALATKLGLTAAEYRAIVRSLGRTPTYAELGMFSVMWSEHCSYKHSRRIIAMYPKKGPLVLQGPGENAGGVRLAPNLAVLLKVESHNHPSMVEPYQGAATGVGGILRDIFTMGARPIALMDSLRFGLPNDPKTRRIVTGVVAGIGGYGNCIGIPTVGGELEFSPSYKYNCLVNAMAVGVIDPKDLTRAKAAGAGNLVVYMGSMTGRDGIHGASLLASQGFTKKRKDEGGGISAVQVSDPFLGKLLMEASIELCTKHLLVGMQDMGAAGLTCSTIEMSAKGNSGMDVDLDRIPQRAAGMTPYEILLSESQERMFFVVEPRKWKAVRAVVRKYGIPFAVVGKVRSHKRVRLMHHGRLVVDIPPAVMADGVPLCPLPKPVRLAYPKAPPLRRRCDPQRDLLSMLADPSLGSKRPVWRQYDHMVRTNTAILPGSDAGVLRLKGTDFCIAITVDGPGRLVAAHPFIGGQLAMAEAARNVACAGGKVLAFTNGLNFPNPDRPGNLWQFREAVRGIALAARRLRTPVVSGNVSFYNEHQAAGIDPTPIIGMLGVLDGYPPVPQWFRREGDLVVLLGPGRVSLNASAYQAHFAGRFGGVPVAVDWKSELALHALLIEGAKRGLLSSAHDLADGGFLLGLAECCVSGADADVPMLGCGIDVREPAGAVAEFYFGEGPSRAIVSLPERALGDFRSVARGVTVTVLGRVGGDALRVRAGTRERVGVGIPRLADARERTLKRLFE
ncbi:MAG: phosphoribosylformylglycinamidine synthase subunit PurL [Candidatus Coatesbacteria bacterium]